MGLARPGQGLNQAPIEYEADILPLSYEITSSQIGLAGPGFEPGSYRV